MATASATTFAETDHVHSLGVVRMFASGGATAAAVFVLCWLGTFIPFSSPTHAYITLFTPADVGSIQALVEGGLWSLVFGAFVGALFALIYNATRALGHR
jgi:hypothetical protein